MATSVDKVFDALGNEVDSEGKVSTGTGATWSAGVAFKRASATPLEKYSLFKDYASAVKYASSNPVAYPGQIIVVLQKEVKSGENVITPKSTTAYIIDQDGTLKQVGSSSGGGTADLSNYATKGYVDDQVSSLQDSIDEKATSEEVSALTDLLDGLDSDKLQQLIDAADSVASKQDALEFTGDSSTKVVTKDTLDGTGTTKLESINIGDSSKDLTINKSSVTIHDTANSAEYILTLPNKSGTVALVSDITSPSNATTEADGLLSKEDKAKLDSYTDDDVANWKAGYESLQAIKETISAIDFENTDETTTSQISAAVMSILNAFKETES